MKYNKASVFKEVEGLYGIIPLNIFRRTPGVSFDNVPLDALPRIDAIDCVTHIGRAVSPGPVGDVRRPWYMHPHQYDNLVVLHGTRYVDIYSKSYGRVESFIVKPDKILAEDETVIFDGPAMLVWPPLVFHRIRSLEEGSAAFNLAVHFEGFDIRTNFNIYSLDTETGHFSLLREGYLDQK